MHWIKIIRDHLKISKQYLADYLQTSVHTIIAVERNHRHLPDHCVLPALQLLEFVQREEAVQQESLQQKETAEAIPTGDMNMLKDEYARCRRMLHNYKRRLKELGDEQRKARIYLNVHKLLEASHDRSANLRKQLLALHLSESTYYGMYSPALRRLFLQAHIEGIKTTMARLEQAMTQQ